MIRKFLSLSVLFHAGLFGFLLFFGQYSPPFSDRPMRIRLIEPPGMPAAPAPGPPAAPPPGPRSVPAAGVEKAPARTPPPAAPPREAGRGIRTVPDVERPAPVAPAPAQTPVPPPAKTPEGRAASGEPRAEKAEVKAPAADPRAGTSEQPSAESRVPSPETRETTETKLPPVTSGESAPASKAPPQVASVPVLPPVELPRTPAPEPPREAPRPAAPEASREGTRAIVPEPPSAASRPASPDTTRPAPRSTFPPDASRETPRPAGPEPPQVASRPTLPDASRETPRPAGPDASRAAPPRGGLSLGGGSQELRPPPPGAGGATQPARPSFRDQIASLDSGRWAEGQGSGKYTVDLDNREERFVDYLALLKRRIERVWHYPPEAANNGVSGALLLVFTLNKSGTLIDLRLIQSSGFPVLDEEAIRAIKQAAPYDPFPRHMGEEPWNIRASFHYNLPYRFRRN